MKELSETNESDTQKQTKLTEEDLLYLKKELKLLFSEFRDEFRKELDEFRSNFDTSFSSLSSQIQDLRSEILENQSHNKIFHDTIRSRENSKFSLRHPKILAPNMGGQNRLIPRSSFH